MITMIKLPIRKLRDLKNHLGGDLISTHYCDEGPSMCYLKKRGPYGMYYSYIQDVKLNDITLGDQHGFMYSDIEVIVELDIRLNNKHRVDIGIVEDVARFVLLDLEPCGLSKRILRGDGYQQVRPYCHVVPKGVLETTIMFVTNVTNGMFIGIDLGDVQAVERARIDMHRTGKHKLLLRYIPEGCTTPLIPPFG